MMQGNGRRGVLVPALKSSAFAEKFNSMSMTSLLAAESRTLGTKLTNGGRQQARLLN